MKAAYKDDPNSSYTKEETYFANSDLSSDFRYKGDPTIGFIENGFYKPNEAS